MWINKKLRRKNCIFTTRRGINKLKFEMTELELKNML